jgi:hypothetical protein
MLGIQKYLARPHFARPIFRSAPWRLCVTTLLPADPRSHRTLT